MITSLMLYNFIKAHNWKIQNKSKVWVCKKQKKELILCKSDKDPFYSKNLEEAQVLIMKVEGYEDEEDFRYGVFSFNNPFVNYRKQIIKMLVKEKSLLQKNPKVLGWLMQEHDDVHYASRYHEVEELHDWENPKYDLLDLEEVVGQKYANFIYDAWAAAHDEEKGSVKKGKEYYDQIPDLTMDDYVAWKTHKDYRYRELYPTPLSVKAQMLLAGTMYKKWNKSGCLMRVGPSGVELHQFSFDKSLKIPARILKQCLWIKDKEVIRLRKKMAEAKQARINEDEKLREAIKALGGKKVEIPRDYSFPDISEYSPLLSLPPKAHKSYIEAAKEVCETILKDSKSTKNNKDYAKKILLKLKK